MKIVDLYFFISSVKWNTTKLKTRDFSSSSFSSSSYSSCIYYKLRIFLKSFSEVSNISDRKWQLTQSIEMLLDQFLVPKIFSDLADLTKKKKKTLHK